MVEITTVSGAGHRNSLGKYDIDVSYPNDSLSQASESVRSEDQVDGAMRRMKKLALRIYDTTPSIHEGKFLSLFLVLPPPPPSNDFLSIYVSFPEETFKDFGWHQTRRIGWG